MKKKINIGLVFILLMFCLMSKTHAISALSCRYTASGLQYLGIEYVALVQDTNGKMGLFVSKDNLNYEMSNLSFYIENLSSELKTSSSIYYDTCPMLSMTDVGDDGIAVYLFDEEGEHPCTDDNECTYKDLINRDDFRESIFDDLEYKGTLEIYDERDGKSYKIDGINKAFKPDLNPEPEMKPEGEVIQEVDQTCSSLLGSPNDPNHASPAYFLDKAFTIVKYVAIVLLIVASVIDFVTATASNNEDALKKAVNKTIKRFVYCIIIFLLPLLLKFLLQYLYDRAVDLCGIGG